MILCAIIQNTLHRASFVHSDPADSTMKYIIVTVLIFFSALIDQPAGAKDKDDMDRIRADYYFAHYAFHNAIVYYEKIAATDGNVQVYARLGDCYRLTGDIESAAKWYKKTLEMSKYGELTLLRYGQMLMMLQQYEEAAKWLKQYLDINPDDVRTRNMIAGCKSAPERLKQASKGTPVLLPFNTDRSEIAPTLWNGNLVFTADTAVKLNKKSSSWSGGSYYNIYAISCDMAGNCGDEYMTLGTSKDVSIAWHNGPCTFNAAGDTMFFTRTRYNSKFFNRGAKPNKDSTVVLETMIATDLDGNMKFRKVKPFRFNSKNFTIAHPSLNPSGTTLVFTSTMNGGGSDLYLCNRNKKGKWLKPQNLGKNLNTEGEELFPYFINDSTLYFASDGHEGLGGLDIYVSHWDKATHTFLPPTNVGAPINSSYDDMSMALFPDGSGGYFSSNRPAEKGSDNIYFYKK